MSNGKLMSPEFQIYPAKYFNSSPTYDHWCKLSAADIHALRQEPGFEGQNVYFHLNHPIRYIYIVAPVVQIDQKFRYALITLDDGSGACIDLKLTLQSTEDEPHGTTAKGVTVRSGLESYEVHVADKQVDIGTVVKAKCTISMFRDERQLELKKVSILADTNGEVAAWEAVVAFKRDVIGTSWVLTEAQRQHIDDWQRKEDARMRKEREAEKRSRAGHDARKMKREVQRAEKEAKHRVIMENRRLKAEKEMNEGALI